MKRRILPVLLTLALCLGMLPTAALAAETRATVGAFEVTGDSSNYSYSNGVLTVQNGADITISMASGVTTPTNDRIVVAENATATITLNGVNIKGSANSGNVPSAIDLSPNATLMLVLSENSTNTLAGADGGGYDGAPGIHVPDDATLIIQGGGSLSATGGTSSTGYGGTGIGGKSDSASYPLVDGESCGTVIILSTGSINIAGGSASSPGSIGNEIGGGTGGSGVKGDDGQGIRPGTDGNYTVYGDLELPCDITIPEGATVTIPDGASLTVPQGTTLTNNGMIQNQGGTFIIDGTIDGSGSIQQIAATPSTMRKRRSPSPRAIRSMRWKLKGRRSSPAPPVVIPPASRITLRTPSRSYISRHPPREGLNSLTGGRSPSLPGRRRLVILQQ